MRRLLATVVRLAKVHAKVNPTVCWITGASGDALRLVCGFGAGAAAVGLCCGHFSREALLLFSVKELRALMRERGLVAEGCLEKADFVDAVLAQQAGMAGATDGAAASSSAAAAPAPAPAPAPAEDPLKFELEDSDGEK